MAMKAIYFFLMLCAATYGYAQQEIVIAAEDSWPPFSNEKGEGISLALVSAALKLHDIQAKLLVVPYARALNYTETGKVNACWNVTRQPSTEALFLFGEEPLLVAQASYFYAPGSPLDFSSPAEIPDKTRVGIIIDYEYGASFSQHQQRYDVIAVPNQDQLIKLLVNKRVDVAIMFDDVASYTLKTMGVDGNVIKKGQRNHLSDIYVAFSKNHADSASLAKKLDNGIRQLKASGEYQKIIDTALLKVSAGL